MTLQSNQIDKLLKLLRGDSARERMLHRLHSVTLVLNGLSPKDAAALYGDSPRAVAYWVESFKQKGIEGLKEKEHPTRPERLSAVQKQRLRSFVTQSLDRGERVTGPTVVRYIKDTFDITLSLRQCWRILKSVTSEQD